MKKLFALFGVIVVMASVAQAQILFSSGTYNQNFNSLSGAGPANVWTDNSTLLGWYASQSVGTFPGTYRGTNGNSATAALYSYGTTGSSERALGSLSSGTPGNIAYGARFQNDTGLTLGSFHVSYTGEQWRNGGNTSAQPLTFSYQVSNGPLTSSDAAGAQSWTTFAALTFTSPTVGATAGQLDGNNSLNESLISADITDLTIGPGQELFIRWFDLNDAGNDHGLAVDDLAVTFSPVVAPEPSTLAVTGIGLACLLFLRRRNN
ncbi:MAG: C-terminal target protein [Pedosphaera sp.]|nr:C-terminal target protein [Pedosphaera sp.]